MPQNDNISNPNINTTKSNIILSFPLFSLFLDSLKIIFIQHPTLFFTLYVFTTFPLSLFVTSSAVSTTLRHLKDHLNRLEWLYHAVPIWVEAGNIRDESRVDSRKLLWSKLVHDVPVFVFSLVGLVTIVGSTYAFGLRKRKVVSLRGVFGWVKVRWGPPLLTCLVNFIVWVVWGYLDPYLNSLTVGHAYVAVVAVAVEVYVMGVLGVGLVVSVVEGRAGLGAVRAGWGLMRGRKLCGWALSGFVLLGSGLIGRQMVGVMEGGDDDEGYTWTVGMKVGLMIGLVVLLGWFILWSYVIFTVYYFECRKRNVIKGEEYVDIIDESDIIII